MTRPRAPRPTAGSVRLEIGSLATDAADAQARATRAPPGSAASGWSHFVVTSAILLGLIRLGRDFLVPLVVAALLFILALAITERIGSVSISGWRPPKWLAHVIGMALVTFGFLAIGTAVSGQAEAISHAAPHYAERLQVLAARATDLLGQGITLGVVFLVLLYVAFMAAERRAFREKLPRLCASEAQADHLASILRSNFSKR